MADRLPEIRTEMLAVHHDLVATLDRLGPEVWSQPTPGNEGWTVKDTLAHLCTIEERLRAQIRAVLDGTPFPSEDVNVFNARKVGERTHRSVLELRAELELERAGTLALLDSLTEADLDRFIEHPTRGRITPERVLRNIPDHMGRHAKDLLPLLPGG